MTEYNALFHIFIGDTNYWGKGVATIATKQMLEKAKKEFNLKQVYLNDHKDNIPAQKAYLKNGFKIVNDSDIFRVMEVDLREI